MTDKRVWVASSSFPDRIGVPFCGNRGALLIRNPLDQIVSLFHVLCSGNLDQSIQDSDFTKLSRHWDDLIRQEIRLWKEYYEFWLEQAQTFPLHIMTYEDLMRRPQQTLTDFFKYLLRVDSLAGTKVEQYIRIVCEAERPRTYPPRAANVGVGVKHYSNVQLDLMYEYTKDLLAKFGLTEFFGESITKGAKSDPSFITQQNARAL